MNTIYSDQQLDIDALFGTLWNGRWYIIAFSFLFGLSTAAFLITKPNIYRSYAVVAPSEGGGSALAGLSGQFGGLASLAGISLPSSGNDKVTTALEVMKSRQFAWDLSVKHDLFVDLLASKGWDRSDNSLVVDPDVYNETTKEWLEGSLLTGEKGPTSWLVHREMSKRLQLTQNKKTGILTISVEHYSPYVAQEWVNYIIAETNRVMREKDIQQAEQSVNYLKSQIENTSIAEMKSVFYQLIEDQIQTMMLANVNDEYVFKVLDPAMVEELKVKPKRAVATLLALFLGGFFGVVFVFVREILVRKNVAHLNIR